jgi:hypothetical protein
MVSQSLSARRLTRKPLPAVPDHLGHERHAIELTPFVEGRQDLLWRPDFDEIAVSKSSFILHNHHSSSLILNIVVG